MGKKGIKVRKGNKERRKEEKRELAGGTVAVNLKKREMEKRIGSAGRERKETRRGKREWNWNKHERRGTRRGKDAGR